VSFDRDIQSVNFLYDSYHLQVPMESNPSQLTTSIEPCLKVKCGLLKLHWATKGGMRALTGR